MLQQEIAPKSSDYRVREILECNLQHGLARPGVVMTVFEFANGIWELDPLSPAAQDWAALLSQSKVVQSINEISDRCDSSPHVLDASRQLVETYHLLGANNKTILADWWRDNRIKTGMTEVENALVRKARGEFTGPEAARTLGMNVAYLLTAAHYDKTISPEWSQSLTSFAFSLLLSHKESNKNEEQCPLDVIENNNKGWKDNKPFHEMMGTLSTLLLAIDLDCPELGKRMIRTIGTMQATRTRDNLYRPYTPGVKRISNMFAHNIRLARIARGVDTQAGEITKGFGYATEAINNMLHSYTHAQEVLTTFAIKQNITIDYDHLDQIPLPKKQKKGEPNIKEAINVLQANELMGYLTMMLMLENPRGATQFLKRINNADLNKAIQKGKQRRPNAGYDFSTLSAWALNGDPQEPYDQTTMVTPGHEKHEATMSQGVEAAKNYIEFMFRFQAPWHSPENVQGRTILPLLAREATLTSAHLPHEAQREARLAQEAADVFISDFIQQVRDQLNREINAKMTRAGQITEEGTRCARIFLARGTKKFKAVMEKEGKPGIEALRIIERIENEVIIQLLNEAHPLPQSTRTGKDMDAYLMRMQERNTMQMRITRIIRAYARGGQPGALKEARLAALEDFRNRKIQQNTGVHLHSLTAVPGAADISHFMSVKVGEQVSSLEDSKYDFSQTALIAYLAAKLVTDGDLVAEMHPTIVRENAAIIIPYLVNELDKLNQHGEKGNLKADIWEILSMYMPLWSVETKTQMLKYFSDMIGLNENLMSGGQWKKLCKIAAYKSSEHPSLPMFDEAMKPIIVAMTLDLLQGYRAMGGGVDRSRRFLITNLARSVIESTQPGLEGARQLVYYDENPEEAPFLYDIVDLIRLFGGDKGVAQMSTTLRGLAQNEIKDKCMALMPPNGPARELLNAAMSVRDGAYARLHASLSAKLKEISRLYEDAAEGTPETTGEKLKEMAIASLAPLKAVLGLSQDERQDLLFTMPRLMENLAQVARNMPNPHMNVRGYNPYGMEGGLLSGIIASAGQLDLSETIDAVDRAGGFTLLRTLSGNRGAMDNALTQLTLDVADILEVSVLSFQQAVLEQRDALEKLIDAQEAIGKALQTYWTNYKKGLQKTVENIGEAETQLENYLTTLSGVTLEYFKTPTIEYFEEPLAGNDKELYRFMEELSKAQYALAQMGVHGVFTPPNAEQLKELLGLELLPQAARETIKRRKSANKPKAVEPPSQEQS